MARSNMERVETPYGSTFWWFLVAVAAQVATVLELTALPLTVSSLNMFTYVQAKPFHLTFTPPAGMK